MNMKRTLMLSVLITALVIMAVGLSGAAKKDIRYLEPEAASAAEIENGYVKTVGLTSAGLVIAATTGDAVPVASGSAPVGGGGSGKTVARIAGNDRYATAVEASKKGWVTSRYVILATGANFPDALAGAALAGSYNCPILLTDTANLSASTQSEMTRLGANNCFILGGTAAVSANVESQVLASTPVNNIYRLGGTDRYETAKLIAEKVKANEGTVDTAIIATGADFPDALAASPIAGYKTYPILLVKKDSIPAPTQAAITNLKVKNTIVVGGTAVVSDAVKALLPNPVRKAGANRYATAVQMAMYSVSYGLHQTVYLATGLNFPDALAGGALACMNGSPMLLAHPITIDGSPDTKNFFTTYKADIKTVYIMGGSGAVSDTVKSQVETLIAP